MHIYVYASIPYHGDASICIFYMRKSGVEQSILLFLPFALLKGRIQLFIVEIKVSWAFSPRFSVSGCS